MARWFVIAALIGFPFAMALSWFYEWTPQGIQRETDVEPDASTTRATGKKLDRWIVVVMAVGCENQSVTNPYRSDIPSLIESWSEFLQAALDP